MTEITLRDELGSVVEERFARGEFEATRRGYLGSRRSRRADDAALPSDPYRALLLDRTMEFTADREAAVRELTLDEADAAVRRHLDPARISAVRADEPGGAGGAS